MKNHQQCKRTPPVPSPWYPTRLLDCSILDSLESRCRLVETSHIKFYKLYLTLSHCGGNAECLKLTVDNYAQLLQDTYFFALPQLYQDAVVAVHDLGIDYLWIDSLCITQEGDGHADWAKYVQEMDKVHSKSLCNISATNAPSGHHSMFHSRNPGIANPCIARFNLISQHDHTSYPMHSLVSLTSTKRLSTPGVGYSKSDSYLHEPCISIGHTYTGSAAKRSLPSSIRRNCQARIPTERSVSRSSSRRIENLRGHLTTLPTSSGIMLFMIMRSRRSPIPVIYWSLCRLFQR